MKVLLIIPAYNEADNIERVMTVVNEYKRKKMGDQLDYIIINDGSTDNTLEICQKREYKVINLVQNLGIGGAVQAGYMYAYREKYDIVVQFDGDGQHDINSLQRLIEPIVTDEKDFVVGSRFLEGTSEFKSTVARRIGIRYLSVLLRIFAGCKVKDPTSGYRAGNKKAIEFLSRNYPADYPEPDSLVDLSKNSFRIGEVQVNMHERGGGVSSISAWKSVYYMIKVSLSIICVSFQKKMER